MYFIWINIIMKGIYDLSCSLDLVSSKLVAFIFKTVGNLLQYYKRIYSMQIHTSGFWYVKPHILSKRKNTPLSKQLHLTFELSCSAFQRVELYFNIKRAHIRYQHWFKSAPCDNFWAGIHVSAHLCIRPIHALVDTWHLQVVLSGWVENLYRCL